MRRIGIGPALLLAACAPSGGPQEDAAAARTDEAVNAEGGAAYTTNEETVSDDGATDMPLENRTDRVLPAQPHERSEEGNRGDACHAGRYRHLIGQHRSRIPAKPAGETWRVTCTSCPMTMDYSERRLNILYDQRSGIVEEVRCG